MTNGNFIITTSCNARCEHCYMGCEQARAQSMKTIDALRWINEFKDGFVTISGGEVFLEYDLLLKLVTRATELNIHTVVTTNGFWGKDLKTAKEKVNELSEAGLTKMCVGADRFHLPYVPLDRIKNIFEAIREVDIEIAVLSVYECDVNEDMLIINALKRCAPIKVGFINSKIHRIGRAYFSKNEHLINTYFSENGLQINAKTRVPTIDFNNPEVARAEFTRLFKQGRVPGELSYCGKAFQRSPTILPDGDIALCIFHAGMGENASTILGNAYKTPLPEIIENQKNNLFRWVVESPFGFRLLFSLIDRAGLRNEIGWKPGTSPLLCDLCYQIFSNTEIVKMLRTPESQKYLEDYKRAFIEYAKAAHGDHSEMRRY